MIRFPFVSRRGGWAHALAGALLAAHGAAGSGLVLQVSFDSGAPPAHAAQMPGDDGVAGPYWRFRGVVACPKTPLARPVAGDYTLCIWLRAAEWLEETYSGFGERTPATLFALYDSSESAVVVWRVWHRRLQAAVRVAGRWRHATGRHELPERRWIHAAMVRRGGEVRFYLDGREDAAAALPRRRGALRYARIGGVASRTFFGDLDEAQVWDRALRREEIEAMVPERFRRQADALGFPASRFSRPRYAERRLRLKPGAAQPLAAGLNAFVLPAPWFGPGRSDLLAQGALFNACPTVYRQIAGARFAPGVPVADSPHPTPLARPPWFRADRGDGLFDLIALDRSAAPDDLLYLRNVGRPGAPAFASPTRIQCAGASFRAAYHAYPIGVQDLDRDGAPDLLMIRSFHSASYFPDAPRRFWSGEALTHSGKGRGYSVNGKWLGYESRYLIEWARGRRAEDGALAFGPRRPIYFGRGDFPLQWKGYSGPRAAWLRLQGRDWLVLAGDLDRILAVPARVEGDAIRCGRPADVLAAGPRLVQTYLPKAVHARDLDRDGRPEIVLCGNPGSVVVLRGRRMGAFREECAVQLGGPLAMQTLIVPCRVDWNRDGWPDLIAGDASGWLMLWPGSSDPMVYGSPARMTVAGAPVHIQAGPNGSIQGPNEARWGYLNPTVGDWDADGRPDIVTCDINADVLWFRPGESPAALRPPQRFTLNGEKLPAAWRQRPAILPPKFGIAGRRPCLLHLNWDGVLCIGVPERVGSTRLTEQRVLRYTDGRPVKLDGPAGLWGRAKFAVTDWDRDGVWDVVFGTNRADQRFFCKACADSPATPFLLRNAGTASAPAFEPAAPITLRGRPLEFGVHIAAVWPTDMNGDGRDDLLVGAEDGRVYRFFREELRP